MSDREDHLKGLMLRGLDGDAQAWRQLLTEMGKHLRAFFSRRLYDQGAVEAEDLVQETLIAIHAKRATWDPKQSFSAWAYAVARYKLIDHLRRTRRHKHLPLEDAGVLFADTDVEEGATRGDLRRVLSVLPERQRRLIEDVKVNGASVAEAGAKLGYSETAAKVAIHRSMKTLTANAAKQTGSGSDAN